MRKTKIKFLITICCAVLLSMIFLQKDSFAQKTSKAKEAILFEIRKYSGSGGVWTSSEKSLYIYQSGRIAFKSTSKVPFGPRRGENIVSKTNRCFQITKEKLSELIELAGNTDFLESNDRYLFFAGGVDWGASFTINHIAEGGNKSISLTDIKGSKNAAPLPDSVTSFIDKIAEIDETMKIKREIKVGKDKEVSQ